jgi:hypothetical protein
MLALAFAGDAGADVRMGMLGEWLYADILSLSEVRDAAAAVNQLMDEHTEVLLLALLEDRSLLRGALGLRAVDGSARVGAETVPLHVERCSHPRRRACCIARTSG